MWEVKLVLILLAMEFMDVGSNTLSKAAMAKGMSNYIFTTYTHAISFFLLIPAALLFHRNNPPPPMGRSIILRIFLLGILNCGCSIFLYIGIRYSSPTLASAINNLSPAFTFITAVIFRMENLNLSARSSILKVLGTVVSITGAFIVIFYQGLPIIIFPPPTKPSVLSFVQPETQPNWVFGGLLLITSSILLSLAYVTKTWVAREFRSEVLITLMTFFFETIVAAIVTSIAETDTSVWTPRVGIELISILFGAVEIGTINIIDTWACRVKGPVFVAMFKPLQMIIAVMMGVTFLGDILHIGSVIGGMVIALGFYTVMKGKAEEDNTHKIDDGNRLNNTIEEESCPLKSPMLQNNSMDA